MLALLLAAAPPIAAESLAEMQMHVVQVDRHEEVAYAVVDSIWDAESRVNLTRTGLSADCMLPGEQSWFARIRRGDTLRFKLVRQGGFRLSVPSTGWPMRCRCPSGARTRAAVLQGAFVRPTGLDDSFRLRGFFGPRKHAGFRLRVTWKSEDLSSATGGRTAARHATPVEGA
jgi:hypothetical protein